MDVQRLTDETSMPTRWVTPRELVIHSPSEDLHALSMAWGVWVLSSQLSQQETFSR